MRSGGLDSYGIGPFQAVQRAAWRPLNAQRVPTTGDPSELKIDVL